MLLTIIKAGILNTTDVIMKNCLPIPTMFLLSIAFAFADNSIVQTNYTADPALMVYEGRLYLYTAHDEDGMCYYVRVFSVDRRLVTTVGNICGSCNQRLSGKGVFVICITNSGLT